MFMWNWKTILRILRVRIRFMRYWKTILRRQFFVLLRSVQKLYFIFALTAEARQAAEARAAKARVVEARKAAEARAAEASAAEASAAEAERVASCNKVTSWLQTLQ